VIVPEGEAVVLTVVAVVRAKGQEFEEVEEVTPAVLKGAVAERTAIEGEERVEAAVGEGRVTAALIAGMSGWT